MSAMFSIQCEDRYACTEFSVCRWVCVHRVQSVQMGVCAQSAEWSSPNRVFFPKAVESMYKASFQISGHSANIFFGNTIYTDDPNYVFSSTVIGRNEISVLVVTQWSPLTL